MVWKTPVWGMTLRGRWRPASVKIYFVQAETVVAWSKLLQRISHSFLGFQGVFIDSGLWSSSMLLCIPYLLYTYLNVTHFLILYVHCRICGMCQLIGWMVGYMTHCWFKGWSYCRRIWTNIKQHCQLKHRMYFLVKCVFVGYMVGYIRCFPWIFDKMRLLVI